METNDLMNVINEPTRKNTILDLFLVNNHENYNIGNNIVNQKVSDHNLLSIINNRPMKLKVDPMRTNVYSNKIFEYIIDYETEEWSNFYNAISNSEIDENLPSNI